MTQGHYFEKLGLFPDALYGSSPPSAPWAILDFEGGEFSFDIDRRKVCVATPRTSKLWV